MALVPTLGDQILQEMDVESITHELRSYSQAHRSRMPSQTLPARHAQSPPPPPSESSLASSVDLVQDHDARSPNLDSFSLSLPSAPGPSSPHGHLHGGEGHDSNSGSMMGDSLLGGFDFSSTSASNASQPPSSPARLATLTPPPLTAITTDSAMSPVFESDLADFASGSHLSDSMTTTSSSAMSFPVGTANQVSLSICTSCNLFMSHACLDRIRSNPNLEFCGPLRGGLYDSLVRAK